MPLVTFTAHFVQQPMRHALGSSQPSCSASNNTYRPSGTSSSKTSPVSWSVTRTRCFVSIASEGKPFHATFSMFVSESNAEAPASLDAALNSSFARNRALTS